LPDAPVQQAFGAPDVTSTPTGTQPRQFQGPATADPPGAAVPATRQSAATPASSTASPAWSESGFPKPVGGASLAH
jgi:hypothetical protein